MRDDLAVENFDALKILLKTNMGSAQAICQNVDYTKRVVAGCTQVPEHAHSPLQMDDAAWISGGGGSCRVPMCDLVLYSFAGIDLGRKGSGSGYD